MKFGDSKVMMIVLFLLGFGGKFGVQSDRMDKSAVGHDYVANLKKHVSQTDYSRGFGGKYGVQTDRVDKAGLIFISSFTTNVVNVMITFDSL